MIIISLHSGLGNQMFQYAFAYAQSKRLNTCFLLDDIYRESKLSHYFKLSPLNEIFLYKYKIPRVLFRNFKKKIITHNNIDISDAWLKTESISITNNSYYEGYYQSIAYFEDYQEQVKKKLRIKKRISREFNKIYGNIFDNNKTLVIHIRRTDYLKHGEGKNLGSDDLSLPISYYETCLNSINNLDSYKIFVVGDDLDYAIKHFNFLPNVSFEKNPAIIDFQLIMKADVAIVANSTFSWWAAYLNPKIEKKIYAPKYFLGFHILKEFPAEISYKTPFSWV